VTKANDDPAPPGVVEATGFLVRDPQGRKRVFVGDLVPTSAVGLMDVADRQGPRMS
jgi:hypothetical protein